MFLISIGVIILQLLLTVNLRFVLGETLIALVGGIVYAFIMVHNGIWDKGLSAREASANVAMHGMSGFGIYGVDVFVETDEAEKPMQILEDMDASISKEKF